MNRRHVVALAVTLGLGACMPAAAPGPPSSNADEAAPSTTTVGELPIGFGSLRQDEISLRLVRGTVQVQATPLDEDILRLTAPDTYERLSRLRERAGGGGRPFLVSIQTDAPGGADFEPSELRIESRGVLHRADDIEPLTPGWGAGRLRQRAPEQAVYRFPASVDPSLDMTLLLGNSRSRSWADVLPRLDAERARVRARGGTPQASSPNFLILR